MTWGADGDLYTAWGDGGGFDGDERQHTGGKASLGFARISGTPRKDHPESYQGTNIWGTLPYAQFQATFGGKVTDVISVNGVLYAQGGLWTQDNCHCANPTLKGESNAVRTMATSTDNARSWQLVPWTTTDDLGATLKFGPDYQGALDPAHLYLYYQRDVHTDPAHIYLRRVRSDSLARDPTTPGQFEYWAGVGADEVAVWSERESDAVAVFTDPKVPDGVYSGPAVVYIASLGRYLLSTFHGEQTGQIGIFESANPWGPWSTVAYYQDWGGFNETASEGNGISFPPKWISPDGRSLWAVFSGLKTSQANWFDSFNLARLQLRTRRGLPRILAPSEHDSLAAGADVTARGSGNTPEWSISRLDADGNLSPITQSKGRAVRFIVPADAQPGQSIRITLRTAAGSVYRDYGIGR